jgi:hypothetical protein
MIDLFEIIDAMGGEIKDKKLLHKIKLLRKSAEKHRHDIRAGRRRFGLYRYLLDVYAVYLELRSRRKARQTTRRIAKLLKLSVRKRSHPIRILIEASVGPEDNRAKSRWTQALRYAFGWRQPANRLEWFFQVSGGISGAAAKFALVRGATRRPGSKGVGF